MAQAIFIQDEGVIEHTPSTAVKAGDVVVVGQIVAIAKSDIAAGELGSLSTRGVFDAVKETGAMDPGDRLYWKAAGDPVGGTAGSGALTKTATGNKYAGVGVKAAASADKTVRFMLIQDGDVDTTGE